MIGHIPPVTEVNNPIGSFRSRVADFLSRRRFPTPPPHDPPPPRSPCTPLTTRSVSRASEREDLREVRANVFAAAFLMPEEGVRRYVGGFGKGRQSRVTADVYDGESVLRVQHRTMPGTQDLQIYDLVQPLSGRSCEFRSPPVGAADGRPLAAGLNPQNRDVDGNRRTPAERGQT